MIDGDELYKVFDCIKYDLIKVIKLNEDKEVDFDSLCCGDLSYNRKYKLYLEEDGVDSSKR